MGFWVGYIAGIALGASLTYLGLGYVIKDRPLEACEREHNVYQCELVAVPVAAPTWVPQK